MMTDEEAITPGLASKHTKLSANNTKIPCGMETDQGPTNTTRKQIGKAKDIHTANSMKY